ncbi:hypothetical protein EG68_04290 [Paragonimus skrjabini miyazakii]|uniref:Uncharacterized protein n=1 Tax=Paragonimus skrjabini miyazakii TaxID=59628 RepID=A0A8S9YTU3_9TREM|nr:hypothetical protein EG68_04290 [Paragonimus skrjabini miyazakii]
MFGVLLLYGLLFDDNNGDDAELDILPIPDLSTIYCMLSKSISTSPDEFVQKGGDASKSRHLFRFGEILVNKRILARRINYAGFEYISKSLNASTLWLGCSVNENGRKIKESTTYGIRVLSVAMWYWPLQNHQLLTGAVELYLLTTKGDVHDSATTNKPMEVQTPIGDLEKFVPLPGQSYPHNPYYTAADYYYPMQQVTDGEVVDIVTVTMDKQRNLKCYKFTNRKAYVKIMAYSNGMSVQVTAINKESIREGVSVGVDGRWIRLGDPQSSGSLTNISMNDLVIWLCALDQFESHRFLGYSRPQFNMLTSASDYWTPDFYISRDSLTQVAARLHPKTGKYLTPTLDRSQTGVPGYALASFYKPHRSQFHYSSLDHMQKSPVPLLKMGSDHYLLLGKWINIGLLWRQVVGIILLVDGVHSTSADEGGTATNIERLAKPYVVLGRLNDRNQSTWLTPYMADWENSHTHGQNNPSWEMAHFAIGEVAYFNRFLEPREYNKMVGLLGISELRNFRGHIWFGAELIDSPINQLVSAAAANESRPGPVYSSGKSSRVTLLQDPEIVELRGGGGLRLDIPRQWRCRTNRSFCLKRTYNRPGMLELYLDGNRKQTTSLAFEKSTRSGLSEDSGELYINRAIYFMQNAQQETEIIYVNGAISNIGALSDVDEERQSDSSKYSV